MLDFNSIKTWKHLYPSLPPSRLSNLLSKTFHRGMIRSLTWIFTQSDNAHSSRTIFPRVFISRCTLVENRVPAGWLAALFKTVKAEPPFAAETRKEGVFWCGRFKRGGKPQVDRGPRSMGLRIGSAICVASIHERSWLIILMCHV